MIIKSEVKTLGFWLSIPPLILGVCMLVYLFNTKEMDLPPKLFGFFVTVVLLASFGKILWDANILFIDASLKTIRFKNRFTQISKSYAFDYFDGYIFTYEPMKFKYPKNIYLVKNGIFVKKISSFIYSNFSEIEEGLVPLKNMGEIKYSHWNSFKIFIGQRILWY